MLRFLSGVIKSNIIPSERTLYIKISDNEDGQPLTENISIIADTYKKHITCVCFAGGEEQQQSLSSCCKTFHKYGIKTAFHTKLTEVSQINKGLTGELDYIIFEDKKVYIKDFCPFGNIEDWTLL